jgi:tRNA-specific 2-thiouridylase
VCNPRPTFGVLPALAAREPEPVRLATGGCARAAVAPGGRRAVARAADARKDQSYFLWGLSQEQVARTLFPLGGLEKAEVRRIAAEAGLPMAGKPDSQDFYSGDSSELLGLEDEPGDIVSSDGRVLGRHNGCWRYTVGQRKGLGIGGGTPYHVLRIDRAANRVVVGPREEAAVRSFRIRGINWMGAAPDGGPVGAAVKIRSNGQPEGPVTLEPDGTVRAPQGLFGVAPGQSAVFYSEDGLVLCGGVIDESDSKWPQVPSE